MDRIEISKIAMVFTLPLLIVGTLVLLVKSIWFQQNPNLLALGVTIDLLLITPLVYFLLVRKTRIPTTTIVPFLIFVTVVCSVILPKENQLYLGLFKTWLLPVIELSILSFVLYKLYGAIKLYNVEKQYSLDFFSTLKKVCTEILPKAMVMPVVMEISVFYYGFLYWKKRDFKENEFSYHKNSGTITLLVAIIFIVTIETVVLHIIIGKWNTIAAWVLTFLSTYSGIQILGFLKSMLKRPISIEGDKLHLRYGIMNESIIDLSNIDVIELSSKEIESNHETRKLSFLGDLESHNIIIRLKNENMLTGLYGIKKSYKNLVLFIDNPITFRNSIEIALTK
ncbi:hypothetical protein LV716_11645 [Flagellimonas sp. HMM57]|uniref:hypothetical protein n=1 Tax=unclassified Flagellimonas TaxID=2644544 RepID=UPI0013D63EDB|nr:MULTISPECIES: hypothetical protein [unclassified Flagellimonas]UII74910.1 hypothetical protein LV716_11645 [Flagellimonas sp. HMM57]